MRYLVLLTIPIVLMGCWNEDNAKDISLGSVSLGKQMIDLKTALDQDAITGEEYTQLKETIMGLNTKCINEASEED